MDTNTETAEPVHVAVDVPFEIAANKQAAVSPVDDAGKTAAAPPLDLAQCNTALQRETDNLIRIRRSEQRQIYLESGELASSTKALGTVEMRDATHASDATGTTPAGQPTDAAAAPAAVSAVDTAEGSSMDAAIGGPITTHFNYFYDITDGQWKILDDVQFHAACVVVNPTVVPASAAVQSPQPMTVDEPEQVQRAIAPTVSDSEASGVLPIGPLPQIGEVPSDCPMPVLPDHVELVDDFYSSAPPPQRLIPESFNAYYHAKHSVQQVGGSLIDELLMQDPRTISGLRCTVTAGGNNTSAAAKRRKPTAQVTGLDEVQQQYCHPLIHLFRFPRRFQNRLAAAANDDAGNSAQSCDVDVDSFDSNNFFCTDPEMPDPSFFMLNNMLSTSSATYAISEGQRQVLYEEMHVMRSRSPFKRHGVSTSLKNKASKNVQRKHALAVLCTQIFDEEQCRRVAYCDVPELHVEQFRRYNSIVMTCNRWLMFMSQHVQWDEASTLWLHAWILDYFLGDFLGIYLETLHRARQHCPQLIANLCNFLPPSASALDRNLYRSPLIEHWLNMPPWDPIMPMLSSNKPPPLVSAVVGGESSSYLADECDYNVKMLLIPPAPENEHQAQPPRRISNLMEHLSGFAEVERLSFPPAWFPSPGSANSTTSALIDPAECWRLCQELCMERADAMLNGEDDYMDEDMDDDNDTRNHRRQNNKRKLLILWGWELGAVTALMVAKRIFSALKRNYTRVLANAVSASTTPTLLPIRTPSVDELRREMYNAFPRICVVCFGFPLKYVEMFAGQFALCDMLTYSNSALDEKAGEADLLKGINFPRPSIVFLTGSDSRKCNWRELEAHRLNMYTLWSSPPQPPTTATPADEKSATAAANNVDTTVPTSLSVVAATSQLKQPTSAKADYADSWHFVLEHCNDNLLMRMPALNEFCLTQTLVDRCIVDQVRECLAYLVRREPLKLVIKQPQAALANSGMRLPLDINALNKRNSPEKTYKKRRSQLSTTDMSFTEEDSANNRSNLDASATSTNANGASVDALAEAKKAARRLARQAKKRRLAEQKQEQALLEAQQTSIQHDTTGESCVSATSLPTVTLPASPPKIDVLPLPE